MQRILFLLLPLFAIMFLYHVADKKNELVPSDKTEWSIRLNSPVEAVEQQMYNRFLPDEVLQMFTDSLFTTVKYQASWIKHRNKLPGNAYEWYLNCYFLCWPMDSTERERNNMMDPKEYLYVIDYDQELIAMWFTDSLTLRCKKLQRPTPEDRPRSVSLPRFQKAVEWQWDFRGLPHNASYLARGRKTSVSAQVGHTEVKTLWQGGGEYILSAASTTIKAQGKMIYSD